MEKIIEVSRLCSPPDTVTHKKGERAALFEHVTTVSKARARARAHVRTRHDTSIGRPACPGRDARRVQVKFVHARSPPHGKPRGESARRASREGDEVRGY